MSFDQKGCEIWLETRTKFGAYELEDDMPATNSQCPCALKKYARDKLISRFSKYIGGSFTDRMMS